ncbi:chemotaxis protein CheW [Candidatus Nitrospira bockiana]
MPSAADCEDSVSLRGYVRAKAAADQGREFLLVFCGATHYALAAEIVRTVVRHDEGGSLGLLEPFGLSAAPSHLSEEFGMTGSYLSPDSCTVVCKRGGARNAAHVAFQVDSVIGLRDIDVRHIQPLPAHFVGPERRWFQGLVPFGETVALVIDTDWLLSSERRPGGVSADGRVGPFDTHETSAASPLETGSDVLHDRWSVMPVEEVNDADDTPWAQI